VNYYCHPQALCETTSVGDGSRIGAFAHILPGAVIGRDCDIGDHAFIEGRASIGDRVTIKCGVQIWDGLVIEDDVFIGPNATFTNDPFPRSKQQLDAPPTTRVCRGASIGANATILPGLTIGQNAMVGAGTVVTRSVPPYAIVRGNPALITGYEGSGDGHARFADGGKRGLHGSAETTTVAGVTLHRFPVINDMRGDLTVGEFERDLPFMPKRYFLVFDVPSAEIRGEHAHRICHQFLVCTKGACSIMADDGRNRDEFRLDNPYTGVYLPPMTWCVQYKYSADAVLLVFASHAYDSADYIRTYEQFLAALDPPGNGGESGRS